MRTLTVYFSTSSINNTGYFNVLVSKRREEINKKKGGAGVVPYSDSRQKMHALGPHSAFNDPWSLVITQQPDLNVIFFYEYNTCITKRLKWRYIDFVVQPNTKDFLFVSRLTKRCHEDKCFFSHTLFLRKINPAKNNTGQYFSTEINATWKNSTNLEQKRKTTTTTTTKIVTYPLLSQAFGRSFKTNFKVSFQSFGPIWNDFLSFFTHLLQNKLLVLITKKT